MSAPTLSLRLFGTPQILRDGRPLHGKAVQRRRIALLALLAGAPTRTLSRDRLTGFIWPERDTAQARKLLSEALYVIRRELGDDVFDAASGDLVTLSATALTCDLWAFTRALEQGDLAGAAALSDAPFLDGLFLDEAEEFERWLEGERRRIGAERQRALEQLAGAAERDGRWLDAARAWSRLLHDDPLRSRYIMGAAGALAAGGELPAALQELQLFEERLRRELDVSPEPEVAELARRLRAERPPGAPRTSPSATRAATAPLRIAREGEGANESGIAAAAGEIANAVAHDTGIAAGASRDSTPVPLPPVAAARRRAPWLLGLGVLAAVLAAMVWWGSADPPEESPYDEHRLAVLYFRDGSVEGDLGPVADLITEAVIEQLAGSPAFEVIPVSGVRPFRDATVSLDSIARRLRVGSVIDGSVHRAGERLAVRVRLIDSESGAVVASTGLERGLHELFALEDDIARQLANGIRRRLGRDVRITQLRRGSSNVRAWQLVARGNREREDALALSGERRAPDSAAVYRGFLRADSLYEQAQIEDPDWTRPLVERGWTALAAAPGLDEEAQVIALDRALARFQGLSPRRAAAEAEVLEVRGALQWTRLKVQPPPFDPEKLTAIVRDLERAVELEPDRARAWATLGNIHWMRGEMQRAAFAGRRALEADAYIEEAPLIYRLLFAAALYRGAVDSAGSWCTRGHREYPDDWWFTECRLTVMKYDLTGRPDPELAWQLVREVDALDPPVLAAAAGHRYAPVYRRLIAAAVSARAGDTARARDELERQRMAAASDSSLMLDLIPEEITLLLQFGERQTALQRLRWAIERRPLLGGLVANDPILRTLAHEMEPVDGAARGVPSTPR